MGEKKVKKLDTARSLKDLIEIMSSKKGVDGHSYHSKIVKQLIKSAANGTQWAMLEYFNRIAGKSVNLQDVTSNGESLNASVSFVGASPIVNSLPIADTGAKDTIQAIEPTSDTLVSDTSASGQKDTSVDPNNC